MYKCIISYVNLYTKNIIVEYIQRVCKSVFIFSYLHFLYYRNRAKGLWFELALVGKPRTQLFLLPKSVQEASVLIQWILMCWVYPLRYSAKICYPLVWSCEPEYM